MSARDCFRALPLLMPFLLASCASTPQSAAHDVYSDYLGACARADEQSARESLLRPNATVDACPDSPEEIKVLQAEKKQPVLVVATNSSAQFILANDGVKIDLGSAFDSTHIKNQLRAIKYAIKNADADALSRLIVTSKCPTPEDLKQWIGSSQAQAVYAAAAVNPDAWFQIDGPRAKCQISGIVLNFEVEDGVWKWDFEI